MKTQIKIALPKGRLLKDTSALLDRANWKINGYQEKARLYRLNSNRFPWLSGKLFHERDIPVQVAIGNYDLGICGLDWIEELTSKYPGSALVKVKDLGYGSGALYLVGSNADLICTLPENQTGMDAVRIASEYPNLAEAWALKLRLKRFSVFPLWGGAEVYPPETADLAVVNAGTDFELKYGLQPVGSLLDYSAYLIANRNSWESLDMSELLTSLEGQFTAAPCRSLKRLASAESVSQFYPAPIEEAVWLALPDGHQQQHTGKLLAGGDIRVEDYPSAKGNRRPASNLDGVVIKVIRPQDMPLQVANGNFDLAITGRDWLKEHLYQFPSSPVTELCDLKLGKVRIVAVVSNDWPVNNINELRQFSAARKEPLRIATEYTNIADHFARENHLGMYRIIPTWGATEAFLPEDADVLIENTETGQTIARHNLKIIGTLFESTACLVGRKDETISPVKSKRAANIVSKLQQAVRGMNVESH